MFKQEEGNSVGESKPEESSEAQETARRSDPPEMLTRCISPGTSDKSFRQYSREILEKIFFSTHFLIAYLDPLFTFIRVNRAYAEADGRPEAFFPGKNHFDLYPNEDNLTIFRRVVETGEPFTAIAKPFTYRDQAGRGVTYWDWSLFPVKDGAGRVEGVLLCLVDVTRRVEAEAQLQGHRERLEQLVQQRTAELSVANRQLRLEIQERERAEEELKNALNQMRVAIEELKTTGEQLRGQNAELGSSRKSVDAERRRYMDLFEFAPDGYLTTDGEGIIRDANRGALQLLNISKRFLVGRQLLSFVLADEHAVFLSRLAGIFRLKGKRQFEVRIKPRGRKPVLDVSVSAGVIRDQQGRPEGIRWLLRDVTERKEAELELKESEERYRILSERLEEMVKRKVEELQQAKHLAIIGRMVSVVAHEIRNPLQTIRLGTESLRQYLGKQKERVRILEEVNYGVDLLNKITSELLEYARPIRLEKAPVSVQVLVEEALKIVSRRISPIEIYADLECEDQKIDVDKEKLAQVLVNLFTNSAHAMPGGGTLTIRSRLCTRDSAACLSLTILDTGCGIGERDLEQVYEPFFTTKARGIGLGLPTCKKIIEAHGGTIHIESRKGEGTSVDLMLPVNSEARPA